MVVVCDIEKVLCAHDVPESLLRMVKVCGPMVGNSNFIDNMSRWICSRFMKTVASSLGTAVRDAKVK